MIFKILEDDVGNPMHATFLMEERHRFIFIDEGLGTHHFFDAQVLRLL
jgi:hypothetical protein